MRAGCAYPSDCRGGPQTVHRGSCERKRRRSTTVATKRAWRQCIFGRLDSFDRFLSISTDSTISTNSAVGERSTVHLAPPGNKGWLGRARELEKTPLNLPTTLSSWKPSFTKAVVASVSLARPSVSFVSFLTSVCFIGGWVSSVAWKIFRNHGSSPSPSSIAPTLSASRVSAITFRGCQILSP
jgi:hypothetical protein